MNEDATARWPLSEIAAQQITRLRKQAGLNRDQLAQKCRELGAPSNMTAAAVANIETGRPDPETRRRRRDLTIDELVIFAAALDVPPMLLMLPVGRVRAVEVLPDEVRTTWLAAKWFTGEEPWCIKGDDGHWYADHDRLPAWQGNRVGVEFHRAHDRYGRTWSDAINEADKARERATAATDDVEREVARRQAEGYQSVADQNAAALGQLRWGARQQGLLIPDLIPELAHVDAEAEARRGP